MLKNFSITNFKAIASTQQLSLRPLTFLYGANSSGKSSVLHALALAHHALRTGDVDVRFTAIGGDSIDLGGFSQYVHSQECHVKLAFEFGPITFLGKRAELFDELRSGGLEVQFGRSSQKASDAAPGDRQFGDSPIVESFALTIDGEQFLTMADQDNGGLKLSSLAYEHASLRRLLCKMLECVTTENEISDADLPDLPTVLDDVGADLRVQSGGLVPRVRRAANVGEAGHLVVNVRPEHRQEDLKFAVREYAPRLLEILIESITEALREEINRLVYLGPFRFLPPRHLAFIQERGARREAGGGSAWDVLRKNSAVLGRVNSWLGDRKRLQTPYELRVFDMSPTGGSGTTRGDRLQELALVDQRSNTYVSHRDVGIGVSQVLPVLVTAFASRQRLIAIEQPEIHLHPALQAELGDVLITSALRPQEPNRFLIETHSEHLLLRIMRRMRQTDAGELPEDVPPVRPEDVAVFFVEPHGTRSLLREMPLNKCGELVDAWPGGFFEEGLRELF